VVVALVIVVVLAVVTVALLAGSLRSARVDVRATRDENETTRRRAQSAEAARAAGEEAARRSADAAAAQSAAAAGRIATLETTVAKQAEAAAREKAELAKVTAEAGRHKATVSRLEGTVREIKSVVNRREEELESARARITELVRECERLEAAQVAEPPGEPLDEHRLSPERERNGLHADNAGVVVPAVSTPTPTPNLTPTRDDDGTAWSLLLSRIERQWAATVAALPHELGVANGSTAEQLSQALGREVERLREEVGLSAQVRLNGPVLDTHRVGLLLAAGEAIAVLAADAERVDVEIGPGVVIRGGDWTGEPTAFEAVARAAGSAGVDFAMDTSEAGVRLALDGQVAAAAADR
jgi:hypothetical protein